jgi:ferredoxin--NADP+ reductase
MRLTLLCGVLSGTSAFSVSVPLRGCTHPYGRQCSAVMFEDDMEVRPFLLNDAGVAEKFLDAIVSRCDEEMIGNVRGLRTASEAGLLHELFKPVVALSIERALGSPANNVVSFSQAKHDVLPAARPSHEEVAVPSHLEFEPYHDIVKNLPLNTYKNKAPLLGSLISAKRIVGASAPGEVCHIQINSGSTFKYIEGQSLGVIPTGTCPKSGKPNNVRLYSIASTRYGDDLDGNSVSLCVRRATYWCPELKAEDPAKKGVCSNFLCDAKPGQELTLTGPTGKVMLMPEATPDADLIMVATGTGIAPYRGFLRRLFIERTPAKAAFTGLAWLVLGVPVTDSLLYPDDWAAISQRHPDNFRITYAISREQKTEDGRKMYVQDRLAESAEELFERLDKGAHIYFCGLKGMMPGIIETLEKVATSRGVNWEEKLKSLKSAGQWHVEVY